MKRTERIVAESRLEVPYRLLASCSLALALVTVSLSSAAAQGVRRPEATRAELQATLTELEQYIASSGYSSRLRNEKRREAQLIRLRLQEGDLQVGDSIDIAVAGETTLTGAFQVTSGRVLALPGLPDISLKGVLRSEARDHLTAEIGKYIRNPQVRVRTMIRLLIRGSVARQGYHQVPADALASDALTIAGIASTADPTKAWVNRGKDEIWPREAFRDAMMRGLTLDQLNLRAGDELVLDPARQGPGWNPMNVVYSIGAITSMVYLLARIF